MTISIVLADDHAVVRQGVRTILEADPSYEIVGEAADGLEAARLAERLGPDLLTLDLMMPGLNGLDALRIIRRRAPRTRVVVLSMYADEAFVSEALKCGASAYVLKGGQASELIAAVREAVAERRYLSPALSDRSIEDYIAWAHSAEDARYEMLTPRERQVLQLAAEGKTCPEIATRLFLSDRTVEMHRANLMHKLGLRTQTDLVLYALQHGLLPPEQAKGRSSHSNP